MSDKRGAAFSANRGVSENSLANLRRFQPGQSGNPKGRPKVAAEVRDLARRHGPRALERIVELIEDEDPRVALMAAREVLDRAYGKPVSTTELDDDGQGLTVKVVRFCWRDDDADASMPSS